MIAVQKPVIERRKPQVNANRLLGVVIFSVALAFALLVAQVFDLLTFANQGGRHTQEQAIADCLRANTFARELGLPVWNCGEVYAD